MVNKLCFHSRGGGVNGLCLLPVWLVTLVGHRVARLQQQNFVQLERESVDVRDSEENLQAFPLLLGQRLLERRRQLLKRVLKHDRQLSAIKIECDNNNRVL